MIHRREFLMRSLQGSSLLAVGAVVPEFLANTALAAQASHKDTVLVVIELTGGNDGLNTVIPYGDDLYQKARKSLRLTKQEVLRIDDHVGLNPGMRGFKQLLDQGQLAVVQGVGYPNPNRSHFESMRIWHAARTDATSDTPGWLGRALDNGLARPGGDAPALHISSALLPQALYGSQRQVPSLVSLEQFRRRVGVPESAGAAG